MVNSTHIVNTKRLKVLRNRSDYITSRSRVVVHNFTEIGSLILSGQIGEVLVFFFLQTLKQILSPRLQVTDYVPG